MAQTIQKQKTTSKTRTKHSARRELDSVYVLKLVMYLILGTFWLRAGNVTGTTEVPLPIGFVIGIAFAMHDHFKIDRKVEYALLLVAMLIGFWTQAGLYLRL